MARATLRVIRDTSDVIPLLWDLYQETQRSEFPRDVTSPKTRTARFLLQHPYYSDAPRSFIRGCFRYGKAMSEDFSGFELEGQELTVKRLGKIALPYFGLGQSARMMQVQVSPFNGGQVTFPRGQVLLPPLKVNLEEKRHLSIHAEKQYDPVVYYLLVNQIPPGDDFWRKHAVLNYVRNYPGLTRRELERMGVKSDYEWDLVVDFQDGMQEWLRAVSKPPECDILSRGQLRQRQKKELRLPDVINDSDVDAGRLKGQSYDAQIFRALHGSGFEYLT